MKQWKLGLIAACCSGSLYAAPMAVVASFSILGDVTQQIGGERVKVTTLVGADQDAHAYHMTAGDVQKIRAAKLVLLNGLGLEKAEFKRAVEQNKIPYAAVSDGVSTLKMTEEHDNHHSDHKGHNHSDLDPHVWHDPLRMFTYAANVANALIKVDPQGKAYYLQRLITYHGELKNLHIYASQQFNAVPKSKRKVLTGHGAFGYMGKRYDIQFIAPQGLNTEAEPSARAVAAIIRQIRQEGIKAVFVENIKDDRMVKRIAAETGIKVQGKLYSDALSQKGEGKTYLDMYRYNVRVLSAAMK